jgi:hypothetical protein
MGWKTHQRNLLISAAKMSVCFGKGCDVARHGPCHDNKGYDDDEFVELNVYIHIEVDVFDNEVHIFDNVMLRSHLYFRGKPVLARKKSDE